MSRLSILCFSLLICLYSCKKENSAKEDSSTFDANTITAQDQEVKEVVYSMYLPTDLSDIFTHTGTNFNPDYPAPLDVVTLYSNEEQMAIMLGIYGVDLTYMKLLEQTGPATVYFKAIESLAEKMLIPKKIFESSNKQLESYYNEPDSLSQIIERVYKNTDHFFRFNGKENYAALALTGGWVEAMYIGVRIYQESGSNVLMAEKLLQQKFSLNSVYSVLSEHQESLAISGYMLLLNRLREVYKEVQVLYPKDGITLDKENKRIQTTNAKIRYEPETLQRLLQLIPQIREGMIRPVSE